MKKDKNMYFKGDVHNKYVEVARAQITCLTGWLVSDSIMQGRRNWAGSPPPDFGRSVNPISIRGGDYAHQITKGQLISK